MKRSIRYLLALFIAFSFVIFNYNVKANAVAKMIITNPGEDSSVQMNISYHVNANSQTYVMYSRIENFATDIKTVNPECVSLLFKGKESEYQCKVTLNNLEPNTRYYYKIGGVTNEKVMSFVTAGGDEFTFAHVTDIHSYFFGLNNTRVDKANTVLNKMNSIKELDFILASGDVVAYGTEYNLWESLYEMNLLKTNMFALTPGNHDYYNASAVPVGIEYFNAVTNNPQNGANQVKNSTYFFKYGNALFISLDSEAADHSVTYRENQIKWLNEVTANNPADFIIAFTHRPFYTGDGRNAGQAQAMRQYFQEIFDNTGVDLVLSGHNHVFAKTYQIYKNERVWENALGTYYMTGIQIGDRYQQDPGTKPTLVEYALYGNNQDGGNLITVSKDKISVEFVKHDGTRLYPFIIYSKSELINKSNIENSINTSKDLNNNTITVNFDIPSPGLIKKVELFNPENELLASSLNPTEGSITIEDVPAVGKYNFKIKMTLRNGEVIEKNPVIVDPRYNYGSFSNIRTVEKDYHTELHWDSLFTDIVSHIDVYVNDNLLKKVNKTESYTVLDRVSPYKANKIILKIISKDNRELYTYELNYGENQSPVDINFDVEEVKLKVGDKIDLDYTVTPNQPVNLQYTSSNPEVAYVDENGKLVAVAEGECEITINIVKRWDVSATLKVIVEAAPKTQEKKGCFSSGYIFMGITALGLALIIRKRKSF